MNWGLYTYDGPAVRRPRKPPWPVCTVHPSDDHDGTRSCSVCAFYAQGYVPIARNRNTVRFDHWDRLFVWTTVLTVATAMCILLPTLH